MYTYDGLYAVETATMEKGQEGFQICKCELLPVALIAHDSPTSEKDCAKPVETGGSCCLCQ